MPLIANILPLLISHIFPITPLTSRNPLLLQYSSRKEKKKKKKNVSHHANEIPRYRNLFQFNVKTLVSVKLSPSPSLSLSSKKRKEEGGEKREKGISSEEISLISLPEVEPRGQARSLDIRFGPFHPRWRYPREPHNYSCRGLFNAPCPAAKEPLIAKVYLVIRANERTRAPVLFVIVKTRS